MAYDDSPLRRQPDVTNSTAGSEPPRFPGEAGFRSDPGFPPQTYRPVRHRGAGAPGTATSAGTDRTVGYGEPPATPAYRQPDGDSTATIGTTPAEVGEEDDLEEVDAPEPRDRLAVHWLWELVLLLAVGALGYLLWQVQPDALRGDGLSGLLVLAAGYGLLALGAGVTLRAAVPNLAIGPVAAASMIYFAQRGADGVVAPTVLAVGAALVLGMVVAVLVVAFHVPGWAASLGAAVAVLVWIQLQPAEVELAGAFDPTGQATFLFMSVAAMGMLGGLLGTVPSLRRTLGGLRPTGDPADRRGGAGTAVLAAGAIIVSMIFAVPAGVLLAAASGGPVVAGSGLELTVIGMAVALIGGTSVFGRRGGVLGGTLAVLALMLFHTYQREQGWQISLLATAAVALALGLVVSRLIETFGRPRRDDAEAWSQAPLARGEDRPGRFRYVEPEPASPASAESAPGGWSTGTDSWSSALPAQPAPSHPDPWGDDRWRGR